MTWKYTHEKTQRWRLKFELLAQKCGNLSISQTTLEIIESSNNTQTITQKAQKKSEVDILGLS
jgi:hypothetical protein